MVGRGKKEGVDRDGGSTGREEEERGKVRK